MKPIILFDLDGTLIDSTEAILESFHHSLNTLEHPDLIHDDQIKALIGHPLDVMFSRLGCTDEKVNQHVLTYKEYYRHISRQKTFLLPFAKEAIEEAAAFARLGIVTTKTARYSQELMEHFGVMHFFEVLIGYESVSAHKPHPEPIQTALRQMGHIDEKVWMIGDTRLDLESSMHAGVEAVGVLSGYDTYEELALFNYPIKENALQAIHHIIQR